MCVLPILVLALTWHHSTQHFSACDISSPMSSDSSGRFIMATRLQPELRRAETGATNVLTGKVHLTSTDGDAPMLNRYLRTDADICKYVPHRLSILRGTGSPLTCESRTLYSSISAYDMPKEMQTA